MAPASQLVAKLKVQLKLSISRLRMIQQKDSALAKQQRRDMAQLLEQGKLESARIRVENIIRSDILTELHEVLELYCELLLARIQLLDSPASVASPPHTPTPSTRPKDAAAATALASTAAGTTPIVDPALDEAIRSLIHAAPRTDVKELHAVRALLVERAGKDAAAAAMQGVGVADRVLRKLRLESPASELVDAYLGEIARTYGVDWRPPGSAEDGEDDDEGGGGGIAETAEQNTPRKAMEAPLSAEHPPTPRADELSRATPPRDIGPASPVRVAPPSPSTDNVAPKVKLPGPPDLKPGGKMVGKGAAGGKTGATKGGGKDGPGGKIPDVDELAKRFAALK